MAITDPWILRGDVVLTPVEDLPVYLREQLEYEEGDYVITRPRSRTTSRIIDAQTAELLKTFQTPMTIAQAVIRFSQANKLNAEQVLIDAFSTILNFIDASFLVSEGSDHVQQILPSFAVGDQVADCEVLNCVHLVEDTEVYQVKRTSGEIVALKISRSGQNSEVQRMLEWEISILKHLDGKINPALLEAGIFKGRQYLIIEWCSGVGVAVAAQDLRNHPGADNRRKLLDLCSAILDAYSHLHAQGVIHADIHPDNILVASDGSVRIIDYGFACREGIETEEDELRRADISYFSEPEYAKAILAGLRVPAPSMKGEQFSLAALLYYLLTGTQYLKFSLEREEMLQRIVTGRPLPFSRWGIKPWLDVETLLATALSKHPADRFPSVAEFARGLREVVLDEQPDSARARHAARADALATQELLNSILQGLGPEGSLLPSGLTIAPTCSLVCGMAGIAYAFYRIACAQNNAALLSLADNWSTKAVNNIKGSSAFYNEEDMTPEIIGYTSPYHTASGVYCVQALISHARGDLVSQQEAIGAFIESSKGPCENRDLTLGCAGTLLASSFLLDIAANNQMLKAAPLLELGDEVMRSIWNEINLFPAVQECSEIMYLGIAHGWAGLLYATMCWCQSSGTVLPDATEERLQQLAACAERSGQGVRWKWMLPQPGQKRSALYMPGWCNGSAGYIHLWTLAHRMFGDEMYAQLAEQSAWNAWEESGGASSLCCGLAGQAYGLLNLYKHTGESSWLARAQQLAQQAALNVKDSALHGAATRIGLDARRESLYHGDVGIAVLAAELERPEEACMPFFEREGWPVHDPQRIRPDDNTPFVSAQQTSSL